MQKVITIAGSDSICGAGVQLDLKVFRALGVYGTCAVTAITAQNTLGIQRILTLPPEIVAEQIDSVLQDINIDACKTGMLYTKEIVEIVIQKVVKYNIKNLVVDPVIFAKDGTKLLQSDAIEVLKNDLLPLAKLATPNLQEAQILADQKIETFDDFRRAAKIIHQSGLKNVLITGGHLKDKPTDLLFDGQQFYEFKSARIPGKPVHGTGCALSSAIAAGLAKGKDLKEAIESAKTHLKVWLKTAQNLGRGNQLMVL